MAEAASKFSIDDFLGPDNSKPAQASPSFKIDEFLGPEKEASGQPQAASPPSPTSYPTHLAKLAGQSLAQGALGTLQLPAALSDLVGKYVVEPIGNQLGLKAGSGAPVAPISHVLASSAQAATPTSEVPQGEAESLGAGALRGLGGAALAAPLGGPLALSLASGAAGGAAGQGAKDAGAPGWAQLVAGALPGLAFGGWAGARQAASEADAAKAAVLAASSRKAAADEASSAASLGLPDSPLTKLKQAQASQQTQSAQSLASFTSKSAQARDAMIADADKELTQRTGVAQASRSQIADTLGSSTTPQEAGSALQAHARDWLSETLPTKQTQAWAPIDAAIPASTPMSLGNFRGALDAVNSRTGALQGLSDLLGPKNVVEMQKRLEATLASGDTPTWGDVQKFRSQLGEGLSNPQTVNDTGRQNLSKLYTSLTEDMKGAAETAGVGDQFAQASSESKRLFDLAQGPISKIVASKNPSLANDPKPEEVAASLLSGGKKGSTDLQALASEGFPLGELASANLRGDGAEKWMAGLSPEAKGMLLPPKTSDALQATFDEANSAQTHNVVAKAAANAQHDLGVADVAHQLSLRPDALGARADATSKALKIEKAQAAQALEKAQAALPQPGSDQRLIDMLHSVHKSPIGYGAGVMLDLLHSGLPSGLAGLGEAAGAGLLGHAAAGLAQPLYSGAKAALRSPQGRLGAGLGTLGASSNGLGGTPLP